MWIPALNSLFFPRPGASAVLARLWPRALDRSNPAGFTAPTANTATTAPAPPNASGIAALRDDSRRVQLEGASVWHSGPREWQLHSESIAGLSGDEMYVEMIYILTSRGAARDNEIDSLRGGHLSHHGRELSSDSK
jgi:hypothetical protein